MFLHKIEIVPMISVSLEVVSVDVVVAVVVAVFAVAVVVAVVVVDIVELAVVVVTVVVVADAGFIGILSTTQDEMTDPEEEDASVKSEARASLQAELSTS